MGKADCRTARNVTLSISEEGYRKARIWAARQGFSMSAGLAFLIENLEDMSRIARQLHSENPDLPQKLEARRNGKIKTSPVKL